MRKDPMYTNEPRRSINMLAAIAGGSALVALAAMTAALHMEQAIDGRTDYVGKAGQTVTMVVATTTTEPTALPTEKAVPPVKAKPYGH
jgi:hypothetical protein